MPPMGNASTKDSMDVSAKSEGTGRQADRASKSDDRRKPPVPPEGNKSGSKQQPQNDVIEQVVGNFGDMVDGQMKEVAIAENRVLLAREKGQYYALNAKCTHYSASLAKGVLHNGVVRCPWHGACFDIATGDIEDFPGLDGLHTFEVRVDKDKVIVRASAKALEAGRKTQSMVCKDPSVLVLFLIIGGGPAGLECAETLRKEGFKGRIIIATKELDLPYDRPKLTKSLTSKASEIVLRKAEFLNAHDIEIMLGFEAIGIDTESNFALFRDKNGEKRIEFDSLLLATGGRPIPLSVPGADLENVLVLRYPADANRIASSSAGKQVVIVGASFIGMEMAASLVDKAGSVTVIGRSATPFARVFGERIGTIIKELFEEKGVKLVMNADISELVGDESRSLTEVVLNDGRRLPADVCIVGAGVAPSTEFLHGSGIDMDDQGNVKVNKYMQTNFSNIYAAGDIAAFPLSIVNDAIVNIGHWQLAHYHGKLAALNMMLKSAELHTVPYFWTTLFGKSIRYAGYGAGFDDVVFHGDNSQFVAYYTKGQQVLAVASLNSDPVVSQVAEVMKANKRIQKDVILNDRLGFLPLLKESS